MGIYGLQHAVWQLTMAIANWLRRMQSFQLRNLATGSCYYGWTRAPVLSHLIFHCLVCGKDSLLAKMRFGTFQEAKPTESTMLYGQRHANWPGKGNGMRARQKEKGHRPRQFFLHLPSSFSVFPVLLLPLPVLFVQVAISSVLQWKANFPSHTQFGLGIRSSVFGLWAVGLLLCWTQQANTGRIRN